MLVYNIRRAKYADELSASGIANRWNHNFQYVIYTSNSIPLAVLELVAHRNDIHVNAGYKLLTIELTVTKRDITEVKTEELPKDWCSVESYPALQKIGSKWYQSRKSLLLEVPSSLVPQEKNYLINTRHPDFFKKTRIAETKDFNWDRRLITQ